MAIQALKPIALSVVLAASVGISGVASAAPAPRTPPLLWQNETTGGYEIGAAVAAGHSRVAVAGERIAPVCVPGACGADASLSVYDAATGVLTWTSVFDLNRTFDTNNAVAIADHVVITAGYSRNSIRTFGHDWWVVSAYDLETGVLKWRDVLGDESNDYFPWQIAIAHGHAYVTGPGGGTCATGADSLGCDQVIRAYDIVTGHVLWTLRTDVAGGDDETLSIVASGKYLYVGGCVGAGPGDPTIGPDVRAYDADTGQLLWEDMVQDPVGTGFVFKVAANGDQVVAGMLNNNDWLIRAYDARTGTALWSRTFSELAPGLADVFDAPVQLAVDEDVVLVGGYGSTLPFGTEAYPKASRDWAVVAYDARTGRQLWSDVHGSPIDADEVDGGVILRDGQAFALGFISDANGVWHTEVRAYDAQTGRLLWDDVIDRKGFPFGVTVTLTAGQGRLIAVSYVQGTRPPGTPPPASFGVDMLVRAYQIRDDHYD